MAALYDRRQNEVPDRKTDRQTDRQTDGHADRMSRENGEVQAVSCAGRINVLV